MSRKSLLEVAFHCSSIGIIPGADDRSVNANLDMFNVFKDALINVKLPHKTFPFGRTITDTEFPLKKTLPIS